MRLRLPEGQPPTSPGALGPHSELPAFLRPAFVVPVVNQEPSPLQPPCPASSPHLEPCGPFPSSSDAMVTGSLHHQAADRVTGSPHFGAPGVLLESLDPSASLTGSHTAECLAR
ncbi:unnamed protein product [Caretta caretta]